MEDPAAKPRQGPLSEKELNSYRQWAAELQEEARSGGGGYHCDAEVWEYFNPASPRGRQIYKSYTDEELLDVVTATMDHPGHTPQFQEIHEIYRRYLSRRFGGLSGAKAAARRRYKRRRDELRWSWDWPERVSVEPVLERFRQRGLQISKAERAILERLCQTAKDTRMPPELSPDAIRCLQRLGNVRKTLEQMGIPRLERGAMKHMRAYWQRQADLASGQNANENHDMEASAK